MKRTLVLISVLALTLTTFAVAAEKQEQQPQVTKHWSPYKYPVSFPEGARIYIIVKGDTLWDIAAKHYNNPLLWPHIHAANPYITDPHWIYPGDPLMFPELDIAESGVVKPGEAEEGAPGEEVPGEPGAEEAGAEAAAAERQRGELTFEGQQVIFETEPRPSHQYMPAALDADLYCCPMVYRRKLNDELILAGREEGSQIEIGTYDIVYLKRGHDRLKPGEIYVASLYVMPVADPESGGTIGHAYQEVGLVQILIVSERHAIAEVISACDGMKVGAILTPYVRRPNPIVKVRQKMTVYEQYREYDFRSYGRVIHINYNGYESATNDLVCINLGTKNGIKVGDRLIVIKPRDVRNDTTDFAKGVMNPLARGIINRIVGEVTVIRVTETTATVKITYSVVTINVGDPVLKVPPFGYEPEPKTQQGQ